MSERDPVFVNLESALAPDVVATLHTTFREYRKILDNVLLSKFEKTAITFSLCPAD